MSWFTKLRIYFNHGRGVNGDHQQILAYAQLASRLANELSEELSELQAAKDPMRALVTRVNRYRKE